MIREAGMQRMAGGMVVGGALGPAVQATGRALTGVDEEQIDAYRSEMSEVSSTTLKASDLIFGLL